VSEIEAAVVREQGVEFVVVSVNRSVAHRSNSDRASIAAQFSRRFSGRPAILCWQDSQGTFHFYGRTDIVRFLKNVSITRLPWAKYRVA
jgi:hypothetical protein